MPDNEEFTENFAEMVRRIRERHKMRSSFCTIVTRPACSDWGTAYSIQSVAPSSLPKLSFNHLLCVDEDEKQQGCNITDSAELGRSLVGIAKSKLWQEIKVSEKYRM